MEVQAGCRKAGLSVPSTLRGSCGESHASLHLLGYSLGGSIILALGKNLLLCIVQEGKEQEEESNVGCHPTLGSNGLFTNTTCCHRPESDTVGKAP